MYTEEERAAIDRYWKAMPPRKRVLLTLGSVGGVFAFWGAVFHWGVPAMQEHISLATLLAGGWLALKVAFWWCLAMVVILLIRLLR